MKIDSKYVRQLPDGRYEYGSVKPVEEADFRPEGTADSFEQACALTGIVPPAAKKSRRRET